MRYESRAGYVGGAVLLVLALLRFLTGSQHLSDLLLMVLTTAVVMVAFDLWARRRWQRGRLVAAAVIRTKGVWRSAFVRFLVNGAVLVFGWFLVSYYPFFRAAEFDFTRLF